MNRVHTHTGQSLVEILFAIAVFTIGVVTIGYLIFDSFTSLRIAEEEMQARFLASEGLEAIRSILEHDFDAVTAGEYGLALTSGVWSLNGLGDTQGKFSRYVSIVEVDGENKEATAHVSWGDGISARDVSLATIFSDWEQQSGDAASLDVDFNNAMLSSSSTVLSSIALRNTGAEDITLTEMSVEWTPDAVLQGISIRANELMNASTTAISGETIDIADYTIGAGTGYHLIDGITFSQSVADTDFLLTFTLSDQSKRYVVLSL